jgi:hypothetical protein
MECGERLAKEGNGNGMGLSRASVQSISGFLSCELREEISAMMSDPIGYGLT